MSEGGVAGLEGGVREDLRVKGRVALCEAGLPLNGCFEATTRSVGGMVAYFEEGFAVD